MNQKLSLLIVCIIPLFYLFGCEGQNKEDKNIIRPVRAIQLSDASVLVGDIYPGRAKATQEANLSFRVSGQLIELPVNVGDEVKKGDILARIDPNDFEVTLKNTQAQLSRARAVFTRADKDYNRYQAIVKKNPGFVSKSQIDMARAARDGASANVSALLETVKSADDRLRYTYLKATFDGKVVAKYVKNHEFVNSTMPVTPIVRLVDNSRVEMVVNVPESKIAQIPNVTSITVRFDVFPGRDFTAKIKEVGSEASKTTRTYPVTLIMDQPADIEILSGMAGNAYPVIKKMSTAGEEVTLVIPVTAVFSPTDNGKSYVWVINTDDNSVSRRAVSLAQLQNSGIPVIEGVKVGEWIVTAGVSYLHEGQKVKVLQEESKK